MAVVVGLDHSVVEARTEMHDLAFILIQLHEPRAGPVEDLFELSLSRMCVH